MMTSIWRWTLWVAFLALAAARPGIDALERTLVAACWSIPSAWNAVADVAIKSGAIDSTIGGEPAPWRQASVLDLGDRRVAVVTVSDFERARITFLTRDYEVLGVLERTTAKPALVTDETRGYKPLSHIWPLVEQDNRILTLVATAPQLSEPLTLGVFAYVAVGQHGSELLFVCELRWGPGPTHAELDRADVDRDGYGDLVLYAEGRRDTSPIATFRWDPAKREYLAAAGNESRPFISWWSTAPANRIVIDEGRPIDDALAAIARELSVSAR